VRNHSAQAALIEEIVPWRASTSDKQRRSPFRSSGPGKANLPAPELSVTRVTKPDRGRRGAQFEAECDRTTYSCGCGYVFQAAVLTSVACPHCGDAQAW
jgi:hypothetical protein